MNSFLSIDVGTTGLKVALLTETGKIVGSESCEYPILSPRPGYAEQDPETWWTGFVTACRSLKSKYPTEFGQIAGIGICGQMHTQVYLDKDDQILGPAITWMDQRSSDIVDNINGDADSKNLIFEETKNFATTTYTGPQVKWIKDHQPDVWRKTTRILVAKDFVKFKLTGQMVTDYSEASGTLLFDVEKRRWSDNMFDYFGFSRSLFPQVGPSDEIIGQVTREASELSGIRAGTPVANGSADGAASALGAGVIDSGQVGMDIGTSGGIGVLSDKPLVDPHNRTACWCHCLRDRWCTMGCVQTAGASLNWFKNAFDKGNASLSSGDIFEQYNQLVQEIPDGCGGLIQGNCIKLGQTHVRLPESGRGAPCGRPSQGITSGTVQTVVRYRKFSTSLATGGRFLGRKKKTIGRGAPCGRPSQGITPGTVQIVVRYRKFHTSLATGGRFLGRKKKTIGRGAPCGRLSQGITPGTVQIVVRYRKFHTSLATGSRFLGRKKKTIGRGAPCGRPSQGITPGTVQIVVRYRKFHTSLATGGRFLGRKKKTIGRGAPCGCPSSAILASELRCVCPAA